MEAELNGSNTRANSFGLTHPMHATHYQENWQLSLAALTGVLAKGILSSTYTQWSAISVRGEWRRIFHTFLDCPLLQLFSDALVTWARG